MFSAQCSVFSVQCSVFSVQYLVFSVQCSVFSVQCSVGSVLCAVLSVQCKLHNLFKSIEALQSFRLKLFIVKCIVQCAVCSVQCSVYIVELCSDKTIRYVIEIYNLEEKLPTERDYLSTV